MNVTQLIRVVGGLNDHFTLNNKLRQKLKIKKIISIIKKNYFNSKISKSFKYHKHVKINSSQTQNYFKVL